MPVELTFFNTLCLIIAVVILVGVVGPHTDAESRIMVHSWQRDEQEREREREREREEERLRNQQNQRNHMNYVHDPMLIQPGVNPLPREENYASELGVIIAFFLLLAVGVCVFCWYCRNHAPVRTLVRGPVAVRLHRPPSEPDLEMDTLRGISARPGSAGQRTPVVADPNFLQVPKLLSRRRASYQEIPCGGILRPPPQPTSETSFEFPQIPGEAVPGPSNNFLQRLMTLPVGALKQVDPKLIEAKQQAVQEAQRTADTRLWELEQRNEGLLQQLVEAQHEAEGLIVTDNYPLLRYIDDTSEDERPKEESAEENQKKKVLKKKNQEKPNDEDPEEKKTKR